MVHFASRPDWVRLSKMVRIGWDVITTMGCDWKYSLSFRADMTTASANFLSLDNGFHRVSTFYSRNRSVFVLRDLLLPGHRLLWFGRLACTGTAVVLLRVLRV